MISARDCIPDKLNGNGGAIASATRSALLARRITSTLITRAWHDNSWAETMCVGGGRQAMVIERSVIRTTRGRIRP